MILSSLLWYIFLTTARNAEVQAEYDGPVEPKWTRLECEAAKITEIYRAEHSMGEK